MITPYLAQQPVTDYGFRFSGLVFSSALAAAVEQNFVVPGVAQKYKAVITIPAGQEVYVAYNQTAAVPGVAFAQGTSEMVSVSYCREVNAGDTLSFISPGNTAVTVAFFALGTNN